MDNFDNNFLYHYCSNKTLLNIITKKQIWLSNCLKSNDKNEFILLLKDLHLAIERCQTILDKSLLTDLLKYLTENVFTGIEDRNLGAYILCFSSQKDSLPQWSMYAQNGQGVAIGFSNAFFDILLRENPYLKLIQVDYVEKEQILEKQVISLNEIMCNIDKILENDFNLKLVLQYLDYIGDFSHYDKDKLTDNERDNATSLLTQVYSEFRKFFMTGLKFKLKFFEHENEHRLICSNPQPTGNVIFSCNDEMITDHLPINLDEIFKTNLYMELILGPKNNNNPGIYNNMFINSPIVVNPVRSKISYK